MINSSWAGPLGLVLRLVTVVVGVLLLPRPLTTLLVLTWVAAATAVAGAVVSWRSAPRSWKVILGSLTLVLGAIGLLLFPQPIIAGLPYLAGAGSAVWGVRGFFHLRGRRPSSLAAAFLFSLSAVIAAPLFFIWPDAASILLAWAGCVTAISAAAVSGWRLLRAPQRSAPRKLRRGWLSVAAGTLTLAAVSTAWVGTSAAIQLSPDPDNDFYSLDTSAVEIQPGKLLAASEHRASSDGIQKWRILYGTTRADGSTAIASAAVAMGTTQMTGPRTVLAWQHGTTGVATQCAPSMRGDALSDEAIPGFSHAIESGWIVVATDYPGQGVPGPFPYLIGEGEGRAALDAVRAVDQLEGVEASNRTVLSGHSQGGHATLWAGQIASSYAPELEILGVSALSAAADPLAVAKSVMAGDSSVLDIVTSLVAIPYSDEYPELELQDITHPAGLTIARSYASRCPTDPATLVSGVVALSLSYDADLFPIDLSSGITHDLLVANTADGKMPWPLFLGQGDADEVIPIEIQRRLSSSLCSAGATVETHEYPAGSHMSVVAPGSDLVKDWEAWVDQVVSGKRPSNCP